MAAISTKATLEAAVEGFLKRTDLTSYYDVWEQIAEEMMRAPPRSPEESKMTGVRVSITRATGTLSTSNPYISKPSDYLEPYSFYLSDRRQLTWATKDQIRGAFRSGTGEPRLWSVSDVVQFDIQPDSAYPYEFAYYNSATSIVGGATSAANSVLTAYPMVYLSAVLSVAYDFTGDDNNAGKWLGRYRVYADAANRQFGEGLNTLGSIASVSDYSTP